MKENIDDHLSAFDYHQELLDYQKRIANILESFTDGFFEVNAEWIVTYWNKQAEQMLAISREKVLGKNLWEVYPDAVSLKFFKEYHRAVALNVSARFEEYVPASGLWFEVAAFPSGKGLSVYFKDITLRKRATELLQFERQKYRDLFNKSPLPQWVYDSDTMKFLDVNEAAMAHYGYNREEFMSMTIADIRPVEDRDSLYNILASIEPADISNKCYVRHRKKNGDILDVKVEGNSIDFENKNARMVMVIDRSVEIQATNAMLESMARYDIVSKATSDTVWDWNIVTGETTWNQGIKGIFGYKDTSYAESWREERIHPDDLPRVKKKLETLIKKLETRLRIEYRFKCFDGSYRTVLDRAFILFNVDGLPVRMIGSMQDITEKVQHIQEIESQNAKLKEISWIQAHKIRRPLSNILGLVELIDEKELLSEDATDSVSLLKKSAKELDAVIKEILEKS